MAKPSSMLTPADWEALYRQLGQIISDEPNIPYDENRGTTEILRWLGRAEALIEQVSGFGSSNMLHQYGHVINGFNQYVFYVFNTL